MDSFQHAKLSMRQAIEAQEKFAESCCRRLAEISDVLYETIQGGGTIYLCGNGGSAADAQHVAAEFVSRFLRERRPLPAVALTTNTSILTAIGNDYSFDKVFSRQVGACVTSKDVLVGISTSGRSRNVLQAIEVARECGATTIGFTGEPGEPMASQVDLCLKAPSTETPRIQEIHIAAWHIACDIVEARVVAADGDAVRRAA